MNNLVDAHGIIAYIGVGSNLNTPQQQVQRAIQTLSRHPDLSAVHASGCYRSQPMGGPAGQPDYINAVVSVTTHLTAMALLTLCQTIENEMGRQRTCRNGPRIIDLDLLLYGHERCETKCLTLPHPRLHEREFVLIPLAELAPTLCLPGGETVRALVARCPLRGLMRVNA